MANELAKAKDLEEALQIQSRRYSNTASSAIASK
jgi:hypothetical protein